MKEENKPHLTGNSEVCDLMIKTKAVRFRAVMGINIFYLVNFLSEQNTRLRLLI